MAQGGQKQRRAVNLVAQHRVRANNAVGNKPRMRLACRMAQGQQKQRRAVTMVVQ